MHLSKPSETQSGCLFYVTIKLKANAHSWMVVDRACLWLAFYLVLDASFSTSTVCVTMSALDVGIGDQTLLLMFLQQFAKSLIFFSVLIMSLHHGSIHVSTVTNESTPKARYHHQKGPFASNYPLILKCLQ